MGLSNKDCAGKTTGCSEVNRIFTGLDDMEHFRMKFRDSALGWSEWNTLGLSRE